jgi:penicillin-binding protein 1A
MAWGRKKSGGRREPVFGLAGALSDLRLSAEDRIPGGGDDKPKKSAKRKIVDDDDDDDEPPPERKPRAARSPAKRKSKPRGSLPIGRLFYWGAVLGLWGAIAVVGLVV